MSGLLFAGIFGFELTWPEVALVVIIAGMVMMGFGYLGDFRLSKEHGITFSGAKVDSAFLNNVDAIVDSIDDSCRLACWRCVADSRPLFLDDKQQMKVILPLLEIVSFNHVLRSIQSVGYDAYVAAKFNSIMHRSGITKKVQAERYVGIVLGEFVRYSKQAASKKIEFYTANEKRRDLSTGCKIVLREKIEKNQEYLKLICDFKPPTPEPV